MPYFGKKNRGKFQMEKEASYKAEAEMKTLQTINADSLAKQKNLETNISCNEDIIQDQLRSIKIAEKKLDVKMKKIRRLNAKNEEIQTKLDKANSERSDAVFAKIDVGRKNIQLQKEVRVTKQLLEDSKREHQKLTEQESEKLVEKNEENNYLKTKLVELRKHYIRSKSAHSLRAYVGVLESNLGFDSRLYFNTY